MVIADDLVTTPDSPELLDRARAGDAEAFCRVAQAHETRLFRQAVALCRNESLAEDLVAETLAEAWKCLRHYDPACRFSTWLYAILLHRYYKSVRRAAARPRSLSALPWPEAEAHRHTLENLPTADPLPPERAAQAELSAQLRRALGRLPVKHQHVIRLRFFEEASLPEMAAVLGCSVGTVKSRLHHALEKLRKMKTTLNLLGSRRDP